VHAASHSHVAIKGVVTRCCHTKTIVKHSGVRVDSAVLSRDLDFHRCNRRHRYSAGVHSGVRVDVAFVWGAAHIDRGCCFVWALPQSSPFSRGFLSHLIRFGVIGVIARSGVVFYWKHLERAPKIPSIIVQNVTSAPN
jgi:hypothetical protein